jgi:hypothetical protein
LTSEVVELAFDRCETTSAGCDIAPDSICTKCGSLSCSEHGDAAADGKKRRCAECGGEVVDLLTASIDIVLDALLRRRG